MEPIPPSPVAAFLADRDEPCPRCGYNLRGATASACPECGEGITLAVVRPLARPFVILLVAALAWVAIAAGMTAARAGIDAHGQAITGGSLPFGRARTLVGSASLAPVTTLRLQPPARVSTATTTIPSPAGVVSRAPRGTTTSITLGPTSTGANTRISLNASGGLVITSGPAVVSWSLVRGRTWAALGLWSALSLFALGLLSWVLTRRARLVREGPSRRLVGFAGLALGLYAVGQVLIFLRDVAG